MSWKVDKQTWIGFSAAVGITVFSLLLCALLMVRSILPESAAPMWLWITYGLASFLSGRIAAKGQGRQVCAFLPAAILYGSLWLLALSCKGNIQFPSHGIGITISALVGALLAFLTAGRKKKKKSRHSKKRIPVHAVRR